MKHWVLLVGLFVGIAPAWAYYGNGSSQSQSQDQTQAQDQSQYQGQYQKSVGVGVGVGISSSDAASEQANAQDVRITETHPKEKTLLKGGMAGSVPPGNDGLMAVTPWGGPAITRTSTMSKLDTYCKTLASGELDATECLAWMRAEAQPPLFLGLKKTERLCRNWLTGLLCF